VDFRSCLEALSRFHGKPPALRGLPFDPSILLSLSQVTKFQHSVVWVFEGRSSLTGPLWLHQVECHVRTR
jgi:hypothetical protein